MICFYSKEFDDDCDCNYHYDRIRDGMTLHCERICVSDTTGQVELYVGQLFHGALLTTFAFFLLDWSTFTTEQERTNRNKTGIRIMATKH